MPEHATTNSRRRRHRLDPAARHDLDVIDRVLVGVQTETAADAELADFVLRLRAERPTVPDQARERLDSRFAERIAEDRRVTGARSMGALMRARGVFAGVVSGRGSLVAAGALATVLVGVVVAASLNGDGTFTTQTFSEETTKSAPGTIQAQPELAPNSSSVTAPSQDLATRTSPPLQKSPLGVGGSPGIVGSGVVGGTGALTRKVERSANLVLAARGAEIEGTADKVIATTDQFGGFVLSSAVSGGDGGRASAEFDLRLPSDRFQQALAAYSGLAHVRERTQQTQDVTDPYGSATARLSAARAVSDDLRARLASASAAEAPALRVRLRAADRRTAAGRAALNRLRNRVNFVSLGVSIVADESAAVVNRGTIGGAFDTAKHLLARIAAVLIVTLALVIPLAVVVALALFGSRRLRRGRRESLIADLATQPPAGPASEQTRG